jgi:hypothetical protein
MNWEEAYQRRDEAAKNAIVNLIMTINREIETEPELDEDGKPIITSDNFRSEKVKIAIEGKVEAIDSTRIMLVGLIQNNAAHTEWVKEQFYNLKEAAKNAFNTIIKLLGEDIEKNFLDGKLRTISQGKTLAFDQSELIKTSIEEIEEALSGDEFKIGAKSSVRGRVESRARTMELGQQAKREVR